MEILPAHKIDEDLFECQFWPILDKFGQVWKFYLRISLTKTCSNALTFSIESARPKRQMLVRTLASPFSPSVEIIPPGAENTKIGQFLIKFYVKRRVKNCNKCW